MFATLSDELVNTSRWRAWCTKCGTAKSSDAIGCGAHQHRRQVHQGDDEHEGEREVEGTEVAHEVLVVGTVDGRPSAGRRRGSPRRTTRARRWPTARAARP